MFAGIIQSLGKVIAIQPQENGNRLTLEVQRLDFVDSIEIGDSIAINGVCLTVEALNQHQIQFYASKETLSITNLSTLKTNQYVNLEKALSFGDKVGGHLISGHIECTAPVCKIQKNTETYLLSIDVALEYQSILLKKDSIAINGVSLTIFDVSILSDRITINIVLIPITIKETTFQYVQINDLLNIEFNFYSKMVNNILKLRKL